LKSGVELPFASKVIASPNIKTYIDNNTINEAKSKPIDFEEIMLCAPFAGFANIQIRQSDEFQNNRS
jgi:hypothetical protein